MLSESKIGTVSSRSKMLPSWCSKPSTIVCSDDVSNEVTAAAVLRSWAVQSGSAYVLIENSTSFDVKARPEWKVTSSRSSRVSDRPSAASSQALARLGVGST